MKHPYTELWLILAIALVLFAVVSVNDEFEILGVELKTSGIYGAMTAKADKKAEVAECSEPKESRKIENKGTAQKEKAACDTTSKNILFIGDSMLEGLSPRMAAYAKKNGHTMRTVIWYSSTSEVWGKSDKLRGYIRQFKPDYIIICLGANELFVSNIKQKRKKYVESILNDIGRIPYVWIGPPNWKEDSGINSLITESVEPGSFFLSKNLKFDRAKDGAHPTRKSARVWMDSVARWMVEESAHPIKMEKPEETTSHCQTIVLQPQN